MKKQQAGFTLIELVLVIVILGILAATALPRFSDLSVEARKAAVNGLAGGIRSASALAHATQLAKAYGANSTISMEGIDITMSNRYPTADANGIEKAISDYTGFTSSGAGIFTKDGATTTSTCAVGYVAAGSTGGATINVSVGGC